ncbi:type VII secretion protein EssC [Fructilactobacillus carniphilus]|uniref:Type VII secretion protein EssC n=1 Tax=Fructilactobacillus carniphilus TaxID=2940297 RepID=A0ABY5BW45_9LACO|nr:type VII secretion protein EssC [Fructilactobacillus carniphilus]USS90287.1 type VII secretion protein EssC [Fructilactobacillus carniphilus]
MINEKQRETRNYYPYVPNFDNSIIAKNDITYIIFAWDAEFEYFEFSNDTNTCRLNNDQELKVEDGLAYLDDREIEINRVIKTGNLSLIIKPYQDLKIITTNLPDRLVTISNNQNAPLSGLVKGAHQELILKPQKNDIGSYNYKYNFGVMNLASKTYINDVIITNDTKGYLNVGDTIFINGIYIERNQYQLKITEIFADIYLDSNYFINEKFVPQTPKNFPEYARSPRVRLTQPNDKISVKSPKEDDEMHTDLIRTALPATGMLFATVLMTLVTGLNVYMMVGMGSMSLITVFTTFYIYRKDKRKLKSDNLEKNSDYETYLYNVSKKINKLNQQQRQALHYLYPNMRILYQMVKDYNHRIFEKKNTDDDFLEFQVGTGVIDSSYTIDFRSDENQKGNPLYKQAKDLVVDPMRKLKDAPVRLSLMDTTVGLVGEYKTVRPTITTMIMQLATFQSYEDVQFLLLVPEKNQADWLEFRWLKHLNITGIGLRGLVFDESTRQAILNPFYQLLKKRRQKIREAKNKKLQFAVHYVMVILEDEWLNESELNEFLDGDMSKYGVTVIWVKNKVDALPSTVNTMITFENEDSAVIVNQNGEYVDQSFRPLVLPPDVDVRDYITHIANLNILTVKKNSIPDQVSFLDLYGVKRTEQLRIAARWAKANPIKSLAVPLGLKGKDDIIKLDLNEKADGPHGLVAGTTGSGKSETLQSYLLSLAVNFSPEDVGFLPIDFKGGGMANLFRNLPHLMGSITNLDGAATTRALASIKAELQKRQRLFDKFRVNSINGYTQKYQEGKKKGVSKDSTEYPTEPLPHLFLISDEFAELKDNQPDFMTELVSTARIGRSLGVHLILATQKPAGVVNDQIWSNSRFHIALKMQDEADSKEVLKTPDAARITQPGRAYLQVGNNELYELFQSAWSGATYEPNKVKRVRKTDNRVWTINELGQYVLAFDDENEEVLKTELFAKDEENIPTQLDAVIDEVVKATKEVKPVIPARPWLPPLKDKMVTPLIDYKQDWKEPRNLTIPLGVLDLPKQQTQQQFDFDLEKRSHTAIYGSPGYGKSTLLQTIILNLARENNPEQVQFSLFDFGAHGLFALSGLPNTSDIVSLDMPEKLHKMIKRLHSEIKERKLRLLKAGVSSYKQYEETTGEVFSVQVVVLDGYDALVDSKYRESVDLLLSDILREGASLGMYLILAASRVTAVRSSMRSNIETQMSLYLLDNDDLITLYGKARIDTGDINGRGEILLDEPTEIQFYLPVSGQDDASRVIELKKTIDQLDNAWTGKRPAKIPMVPSDIDEFDFIRDRDVARLANKHHVLPLGYRFKDAKPVGIDFNDSRFFSIAYEDDTQQVNMLKRIQAGNDIFEKPLPLIVIDSEDMIESMQNDGIEYFGSEQFGEAKAKIAEITESNPAIIYIMNADVFLKQIDSKTLNEWIKHGYKNGKRLIIGFYHRWLIKYDTASQLIKENNKDGLLLMRQNDQQIIEATESLREPDLKDDESYLYHRRKIEKIKMIQINDYESDEF